MPTAAVTTS